jgi:hypothetical protein
MCLDGRKWVCFAFMTRLLDAVRLMGSCGWHMRSAHVSSPETWVDELQVGETGMGIMEKVVFGVDGIVKDRWNLVNLFSESPL